MEQPNKQKRIQVNPRSEAQKNISAPDIQKDGTPKSPGKKAQLHLPKTPLPKTLQPRPAPKRRRFSKVRLFLWAMEVIILAACLEHFILKPYQARHRKQQRAVPAPTRPREPVTPLGDKARKLPGLTEADDAFLAPLEGLATGSAGARAAQLSVSASNLLPVEVINTIGMRFRLIPAGTCLIGSPESENGREVIEVQHVDVFQSHFYLAACEVTQAQWKAVMGNDNNPSGFRGDNRPVEEVTWYDCQRFTIKLCALENVPLGTYRLPTEAEWEYACRAGTGTAFCFGDNTANLRMWADYEGNNYARTVNVASRLPNAYGLYDMHGNVWEWCLDDYKNYPGDNTPPSEANKYPCIRGGNWYVDAARCRSANRSRLPGASHGNMLGFRILRQIVPPNQTRYNDSK